MKTVGRLSRVLNNPRLLIRGLNRAYHRRGGLRSYNTAGIKVFDEDWDNLIVLDACRYDMFEQVNHIEGNLSAKTSRASATSEWLRANFNGRDLHDTVYITANPQLERNRENLDVNFHDVINVWLDEGWDEETGTVLAETMTDAAIRACKQFPHKRLVIHYMQPHYPFVESNTNISNNHLSTITEADESAQGENIWNKKFFGELKICKVKLWDLYISNLIYVLNHVEDIISVISGKTVVTSDHGNYVGERSFPIPIREFGHPRGIYDEELVSVPWLEINLRERREIFKGDHSATREKVENKKLNDRLKELGYY